MGMNEKYTILKENLARIGSVVVAFSGGVDSTLLLKAAHESLGENVLAVTVVSPFFPREETGFAEEFCRREGIVHMAVSMNPLDIEDIADNPPERCYICKKALMSELLRIAGENGIAHVAEGSHADDDETLRPGARAIRELGIRSPLRDTGLTKADIRGLSAWLELPTADKPSMACLASRFPYGERITEEGLRAVDAAERYLRTLGIYQLRVRIHGSLARIEADEEGFRRLTEENTRREVYTHLRGLGFSYIALDLLGYRMGSMHEVL